MSKRGLKRLAKHLQSREANERYALDYLKRLNNAGLDYRGQASTAFAQTGIGMSLNMSVDLGGAIAPGVHVVPSLDLSGARTAHGLFMLVRMPKRVWVNKVKPKRIHWPKAQTQAPDQIYPRSDWKSAQPVVLAYMRGKTMDFAVEAGAAAWAGFGAAFDEDETGATAGVQLKAGASGCITLLFEPEPRQYSSARSGRLKNDVNAYFKDGVKRKAAGWLILNGAGPKAAGDAGAPSQSPRRWWRWVRRTSGQVHDTGALDAANAWDTHDTALVNRGAGGLFETLARGIASVANHISGRSLKTQDLIDRLTTAEKLFEEARKDATLIDDGDAYKQFVRRYYHGKSNYQSRRKWSDQAKSLDLRRKEARRLREALVAARDFRWDMKNAPPKRSADMPECKLILSMIEGHASAKAGAQFVLPRLIRERKTPKSSATQFGMEEGEHEYDWVPTANAKLGAAAYKKRIGFRNQVHLEGGHSPKRRLVMVQDVVISYRSRLLTAVAKTTRHGVGGEKEFNLITMSYRGATALCFADSLAHGRKALPNGSGISFGLSVLRTRIMAYAGKLKSLPKGDTSDFEKDLAQVESVMAAQLRVDRDQLRAFFRGMPDWLVYDEIDAADAYVIESAFCFNAATQLDFSKGSLKKLFDMQPFKALDAKGARPDGAKLELQTLRLRYRLRSDEDRTRNLFTLGWNPMMRTSDEVDPSTAQVIPQESAVPFMSQGNYDEDLASFDQFREFGGAADAGFMALGMERVERVGTEGIVTLHEYHPVPRYDPAKWGADKAEKLEIRNAQVNAEVLVPPLTLFSQ